MESKIKNGRPSEENPNAIRSTAIRALNSAQGYVVGSPGTGRTGDGRCKAFSSSCSALVEWAESQGLIKAKTDFVFFERRPDGSGDEHEAWFDEHSNLWFKATYPNRFGLSWFGDESATAGEYLTRLVLQNTHFADDIKLIGIANCDGRIRVVTSQPHIEGDAAPYSEIQQWFGTLGYICIQDGQMIAWYNKSINVLVADAHEGNVIKSTLGDLIPIDLNVIQPERALLEWAQRKISA